MSAPSRMLTVGFYYSLGSRYSYLASTQLAALARECGCHIDWHPFNSRALLARRGRDPFQGAPLSGQYDWSYRQRDAERWAELYGVPFVEPHGRVEFDSQLLALAAVAAARLGEGPSYSRALFSAMFAEPAIRRIDAAECVARAEACGIARASFEHALTHAETRRTHDATLERAERAGVFGVPTFSVGGELFWGNDRLVLLRRYLDERRGQDQWSGNPLLRRCCGCSLQSRRCR